MLSTNSSSFLAQATNQRVMSLDDPRSIQKFAMKASISDRCWYRL